jgi:D-sedoheptulose 7-phosphate isomerase
MEIPSVFTSRVDVFPQTTHSTPDDVLKRLTHRIDGSVRAVQSLRDQVQTIAVIAKSIKKSLNAGGTLYTCGNGGSAAQALHLAEELIGRYRSDRPPLRAVCLNADPTALTCIANDFGFEQVFARQCEALVGQGDVLAAFSTSGNSLNVINALKIARHKGCLTIGLLGNDGGACAALCDHALIVDGHDSAHIQEVHQVVLHLVCELMEP